MNKLSQSPNYYCTWQIMEWLPYHCRRQGLTPRDMLSDELLFGDNGIAVKAYPNSRKNLFFLVDDGWDVKSSQQNSVSQDVWFRPYVGSCQLSEDKFANYGETYPQRLKTLVEKIKAQGWRGLGVWISPSIAYAKDVVGRNKSFLEYWKIRLEWSKFAGVSYWKVDWGAFDSSDYHKKRLATLKQLIYPELYIENAMPRHPMNYGGQETNANLCAHRYRLGYSDVLRTYDVTFPLSIPTTLSRVAKLLKYPIKLQKGAKGIINAEDEVYLCGALGLAMGVMRYDIGDNPITSAPNVAFGGGGHFVYTRPIRKQLDEVQRAVNWQQVAPSYAIDMGNTSFSNEINTDKWTFSKDQSWEHYFNKKYLEQSAPRVTARNVNLPIFAETVEAIDYPYVVCSRNPNGNLSIATLGRVSCTREFYIPERDIVWDIGKLSGEIAVFGRYKSLKIVVDKQLEGKRICVADLKSGELIDVTSRVVVRGNAAIIDGKLIEEYGCLSQTAGDCSQAGMLLKIGEDSDVDEARLEATRYKSPPFNCLVIAALYTGAFFRNIYEAVCRAIKLNRK